MLGHVHDRIRILDEIANPLDRKNVQYVSRHDIGNTGDSIRVQANLCAERRKAWHTVESRHPNTCIDVMERLQLRLPSNRENSAPRKRPRVRRAPGSFENHRASKNDTWPDRPELSITADREAAL